MDDLQINKIKNIPSHIHEAVELLNMILMIENHHIDREHVEKFKELIENVKTLNFYGIKDVNTLDDTKSEKLQQELEYRIEGKTTKFTPLHYAMHFHEKILFQALIKVGAHLNEPDNDTLCALGFIDERNMINKYASPENYEFISPMPWNFTLQDCKIHTKSYYIQLTHYKKALIEAGAVKKQRKTQVEELD